MLVYIDAIILLLQNRLHLNVSYKVSFATHFRAMKMEIINWALAKPWFG